MLYALLFMISDYSFVSGALLNMIAYGLQTCLWIGTFGNNLVYNKFWVYFSIALFPVTAAISFTVIPSIELTRYRPA